MSQEDMPDSCLAHSAPFPHLESPRSWPFFREPRPCFPVCKQAVQGLRAPTLPQGPMRKACLPAKRRRGGAPTQLGPGVCFWFKPQGLTQRLGVQGRSLAFNSGQRSPKERALRLSTSSLGSCPSGPFAICVTLGKSRHRSGCPCHL